MENLIKSNTDYYSEDTLVEMYDNGLIYFFDVYKEPYIHVGYSTNFYHDLTDCIKDAYECIKNNYSVDFEDGIRYIEVYGLTDEKDFDGNRIYLRVCELSYSYLREYNERIVFKKDLLRNKAYEVYFPQIGDVVVTKVLKDNDLNIMESEDVKKRTRTINN